MFSIAHQNIRNIDTKRPITSKFIKTMQTGVIISKSLRREVRIESIDNINFKTNFVKVNAHGLMYSYWEREWETVKHNFVWIKNLTQLPLLIIMNLLMTVFKELSQNLTGHTSSQSVFNPF